MRELYKQENWSGINPSLAEHRDEFYILTVAKTIYDWFNSHDISGKQNNISFDLVWNKLKLIVNKVEGKSEETIFANINGGKVPLDGADLVRAILMTKSAKEKFSELKSTEKTNEFRVRMGIEIDGINQWWSNEDVKTYYTQFLPDAIQNNDLFKKEFPINLLYKIFYEVYKNDKKLKNNVKNFSFDFFEYGTDFDGNGGNNYYEMYQQILSLHLTLKDWYNHPEIYHLLGYLFFNFKGAISSEKSSALEKIWKEWESSNSKHDFTEKLKNMISDELIKFVEDISENAEQNELKKKKRERFLENIKNINLNWYNNDNTEKLIPLEKLLPLMDVIYFIENQKKGRLPVGYFKKAEEQKEHIMCQHPREGDENQLKISKQEAKEFIKEFFKKDEAEGKLEQKDIEVMQQLAKIVEKSDDEIISPEKQKEFDRIIHDYCLNSIGNIVLLNSHVNQSYSNSAYNEKVARITSEFFGSNCYIRPFTAGVFLEKDSDTIKKEWHWGITEIRNNANEISKKISEFLGWKE